MQKQDDLENKNAVDYEKAERLSKRSFNIG